MWRYVGMDGIIDGINVWHYPWKRKEGMKVIVDKPYTMEPVWIQVYEIVVDDKHVVFAAQEWTPGAYGFYVEPR